MSAAESNQPSASGATPAPRRFYSTYDNSIDQKRRIQIPSPYRRSLGSEPFLLIPIPKLGGRTVALMAVTHDVFDKFERVRALKEMRFSDESADSLRRQLASKAVEVETDTAGRITIPEHLVRLAGLGNEAKLTGMMDWFEIWAPDRLKMAESGDTERSKEAFDLF